MLSVKSYPSAYVEQTRKRIDAALKGIEAARLPAEAAAALLNELVVSLDASFCHRMRGQEGKDGNPLNEVRMLAASITTNCAVLAADSTIKYDPARSIAGIAVGQTIAFGSDGFARLSDAFLTEIGKRFA